MNSAQPNPQLPRLEQLVAQSDGAPLSRKDQDNLHQLGYDAGVLAAAHWSSLMTAERFKYMNIADYRDATAEDCFRSLSVLEYRQYFAKGFMHGFEDEAYDRGEAGVVGFVDVFIGGSVSGSVDVTARRLLRLVVDNRISQEAVYA